MRNKILIIDDEKRIRDILTDILKLKGYQVFNAKDGTEGIYCLKNNEINTVLLDFSLPGKNGLEILSEIQNINAAIPVIIITAYGSIPNAVEAIKKGAYDFIEKPLDAEKILVVLKNAIEKYSLLKENLELRQNIIDRYKMVGRSPQMKKIFQQIELLAPKDCNVLITGESGTGKELVARSLHNLSNRFSKPFVKVNCAAIPNDLIESELFGHKKGSFTGAFQDQLGKFEAANSGTLFLDEIGELSKLVQAKLLQVMEEKKFYKLGGTNEIEVDVRLISATNKNLVQEIKNKEFRDDLFYRLNTTHIHITPLRERPEDIPDLINYYTLLICEEFDLPPKEFTNDAIRIFFDYDWQGNVRELKNKLQEILIYQPEKTINASNLNDWLYEKDEVSTAHNESLRKARENFEHDYILKTLIAHDWNIPLTANYLGIERTNLYRKIKQLGIEKIET